jgi:hypothetical protein
MNSRIVRLSSPRIDAMVFRSDSVRFEACPTFRSGADSELCECGWLEADHVVAVSRRQFPGRRPRRRQSPRSARQTA